MKHKDLLISAAFGALAACALAPLYLWAAAIAGYGGLLHTLYNSTTRKRPIIMWAFFSGYFVLSLHWLAYPMLVQADQFAWFIPLAVLGLPATLALLHGISFYTWQKLLPRVPLLIVTIVAISAAEWVRSVIFTGFPWNAPSQILPAYNWALPILRCIDAQLIIPPLLLWLLYPAWCWHWRRYAGLTLWALTPLAVYAYGHAQWQQPLQNTQTLRVQVVQPALSQADRMQANGVIRTWQTMLQYTTPDPTVTHIIWPEAVLPPTATLQPWLDRIPLAPQQNLIAGAVLFKNTTDAAPTNSLILYNPLQGVQQYNKTHLVPFGEYMPFDGWLTKLGLRVLIDLPHGFSAGTQQNVLLQNNTTPPFVPLICYEGIFAQAPQPQAQWTVLITNDSWFGPWAGPAQHLAQAQMRAAQMGTPMVRAATTGISAIIDAHGRIAQRLPMGQAGNFTANFATGAVAPPHRITFIGLCLIFAALLHFIYLSEKTLAKRR